MITAAAWKGEKMRVDAQSMDEPKLKLSKLEEYIPDADNEMVYDFGRFVSPYLNPQLTPLGFVRLCETAIHDLKDGVSGVSGRPIVSRLVGHSPMVYAKLHAEISNIADAIFSAEFAGAVEVLVDTKVENRHFA
jgi:hypothetical protein